MGSQGWLPEAAKCVVPARAISCFWQAFWQASPSGDHVRYIRLRDVKSGIGTPLRASFSHWTHPKSLWGGREPPMPSVDCIFCGLRVSGPASRKYTAEQYAPLLCAAAEGRVHDKCAKRKLTEAAAAGGGSGSGGGGKGARWPAHAAFRQPNCSGGTDGGKAGVHAPGRPASAAGALAADGPSARRRRGGPVGAARRRLRAARQLRGSRERLWATEWRVSGGVGRSRQRCSQHSTWRPPFRRPAAAASPAPRSAPRSTQRQRRRLGHRPRRRRHA